MTKNEVPFSELRDLLLEVGYREIKEKVNRLRFEHTPLRNVLLFPAYKPTDIVSLGDLLVVRRQLVLNGLIEDADFDRFEHKATA